MSKKVCFFSALCALGISLTLPIITRAATVTDLIGTWSWVAVETTAPDGTKAQPFGPHPQGSLMFDAGGHFNWLISKPNRPKFAAKRRDKGTDEENQATVQGSLAYSGTYSVTGDTLTLKIEASTYPNDEGAEQKRSFTLTGDELRWSNQTSSVGGSATAVLHRLK
jgi:hypothetical protein